MFTRFGGASSSGMLAKSGGSSAARTLVRSCNAACHNSTFELAGAEKGNGAVELVIHFAVFVCGVIKSRNGISKQVSSLRGMRGDWFCKAFAGTLIGQSPII